MKSKKGKVNYANDKKSQTLTKKEMKMIFGADEAAKNRKVEYQKIEGTWLY